MSFTDYDEEWYPQVGITVTPTRQGINQVTRKLEPSTLFQRIREGLQDALDDLHRRILPKVPVDTGQAQEGLYTQINGTTADNLYGIVASPDEYFRNLEYGRRAGSRMPPSPPIEEWAYRHGIEREYVFPIRRAIAARGLPALHIMRDALAEGKQHFHTVFFKRMFTDWGR